MRPRHVATFALLTGGLTAATVLHRRAGRHLPAATTAAVPATPSPVQPVPDRAGVVLPFVRPTAAVPAVEQPATPVRCGDSGGRTKAGAPCAARATDDGRCHHHRVAA